MLPQPLLHDDAPWKRRYRAERLVGATIARNNPARGVVATNRSGIFQLYAWDVTSGELSQVTDRPSGTPSGSISPDGRWIFYLNDAMGSQTGHLVRIPFEGGDPIDLSPHLPDYTAYSPGVSDDGTLAGFTAPSSDGFKFYTVALNDDGVVAEPRLLHTAKTLTDGPAISGDGRIGVWMVARPGQFSFGLLAFDLNSGTQVGELWEEGDASLEFGPFARRGEDARILATTDIRGVKQPFLWDIAAGTREALELGDMEGETSAWEWMPVTRRVVLCQTIRAAQQLWTYDIETRDVTKLDHASGTYGWAGVAANGDLAVRWTDSTSPSRVVTLNPETGAVTGTLLEAPSVPPGRPWRSFTVNSSDGQEVQGWVAAPEGDGPFPTMFETHGGPTACQMEAFMPSSQLWLDHGFAFCTVNYRGSTTFGREFERGIWGNLGHWEVEDMAAAREWLVTEGIAKPDAILLGGASYGGYLTLHALGLKPELWAGGMGRVVVADWVSQYEDENDELRGYDVALFGGALDEMRDQYVKSSPITYVENLRAPVQIIQGRNDTTDPPRQVELYEAKARDLGKDIEVIWFDTGHEGSFMDVELAIDHQELMLQFAYRVLFGG